MSSISKITDPMLAANRITETVTAYLGDDDDPDFVDPIIYRIFQERMQSPSNAGSTSLHWTQRSHEMQEAISKAFNKIRSDCFSNWGAYNGEESYRICGIDDKRLLKQIIQQAPPTQKDFYFLDLGAGNFELSEAQAKFINSQSDLPPGITVHLISVRGEKNVQETLIKTGSCIRYNLGDIKIEELEKELERNGLYIKGKLDLVETRWCCRHLVDPVGTFSQCFDLLRPRSGLFLGDGFFFFQEKEEDAGQANEHMIRLLLDLECPFLMEHHNIGASLHRFIVRRLHSDPCTIPMQYLGLSSKEEYGRAWNGSGCVTIFKRVGNDRAPRKINLPRSSHQRKGGHWIHNPKLYGSKSLFNWLKTHELIIDPDVCFEPILKPAVSITPSS